MTRVDRGWNKMSGILDNEMPPQKDRRRALIWLLLAGFLFLAVLVGKHLSDNKATSSDAPVAMQNTADHSETNFNQASATSDTYKANTERENTLEETSVTNESGAQVTRRKHRTKTELKAEKNSAATDEKAILYSPVLAQKDQSGSDDSPVIIKDQTTSNDNDMASATLEADDPVIMLTQTTQLQSLTKLSLSQVISTSVPTNFNTGLPAIAIIPDPISIAQPANAFALGSYGHYVNGHHSGYDGWNAGLFAGIRSSKMHYILFAGYGHGANSFLDEIATQGGIENMEDELTSGAQQDTFVITSNSISESFSYIETGLAIGYAPHNDIIIGGFGGFNFYRSATQIVEDSRTAFEPANPNTGFDLSSKDILIDQRVKSAPFVGVQLQVRLFGELYFSGRYKYEMSDLFSRNDKSFGYNSYQLGLSYHLR